MAPGRAGRPVLQKPKNQIAELIDFAKQETGEYREVTFGTVPNSMAQRINEVTGLRINGAIKILSSHTVTHILKRHSEDSNSDRPGQRSVTEKDLEHIPAIFSSFDEVGFAGENSKRKECLSFKKKIDNCVFHLIACFSEATDSNGRPQNKIFVNTLYIKK